MFVCLHYVLLLAAQRVAPWRNVKDFSESFTVALRYKRQNKFTYIIITTGTANYVTTEMVTPHSRFNVQKTCFMNYICAKFIHDVVARKYKMYRRDADFNAKWNNKCN